MRTANPHTKHNSTLAARKAIDNFRNPVTITVRKATENLRNLVKITLLPKQHARLNPAA